MQTSTVKESPAPYGLGRSARASDEPWLQKKFWTEEEYLALETNYLIEFNNGILEILPMPSDFHQAISRLITLLLHAFDPFQKLGIARYAPLKVKIPGGKFREPDILFVFHKNDALRGTEFWTGADLVMEIISPDGRKRDLVEKPAEYAAAGISEYWIIDPELERITELKLRGKKYVRHGVFKRGQSATSVVLNGFSVDVSAVLDAK